jgi:hypothetical protein
MKATVLDSNLNIITTELVHFDTDLPHYQTISVIPLLKRHCLADSIFFFFFFKEFLKYEIQSFHPN